MIDLIYKPISYWIGLAMHVGELACFGAMIIMSAQSADWVGMVIGMVLFVAGLALFYEVLCERRLKVLKNLIRILLVLVLLCVAGVYIEFVVFFFHLSLNPVSTVIDAGGWFVGAVFAGVPMAALMEQRRWIRWMEPPRAELPRGGFEVLPPSLGKNRPE